MGWAVASGFPQADPFDAVNSFPGNGQILIGQFSTTKRHCDLGLVPDPEHEQRRAGPAVGGELLPRAVSGSPRHDGRGGADRHTAAQDVGKHRPVTDGADVGKRHTSTTKVIPVPWVLRL